MLATFNEYYWSFVTCGAQISYKTNTVGRSVFHLVSARFYSRPAIRCDINNNNELSTKEFFFEEWPKIVRLIAKSA